MYDILTTSILFVLLAPGVLLTLGPSTLTAAVVHAVVFYVILRFVSVFVPWWGIWIIAAVLLGGKLYMSRSVAPAPAF
jgi:NhaP-type Na+/H+ or K+/H+ antiporter